VSDFYWKDKKLSDLSKEELIEIIEGYLISIRERSEAARAMALGRIEMLKRGEL